MNYKIILYGDFGVGKTSLTDRLIKKSFYDYSPTTIGASFVGWNPNGNEYKAVRFGIWDTAGQERYSGLLPMYLRDAHAIFYCWDSTVRFNSNVADRMYEKAKHYSPDCIFYLVITKMDLVEEKIKYAEEWSAINDVKIMYTSSKMGAGVQELFIDTAKQLLSKPNNNSMQVSKVNIFGDDNTPKKCCM